MRGHTFWSCALAPLLVYALEHPPASISRKAPAAPNEHICLWFILHGVEIGINLATS